MSSLCLHSIHTGRSLQMRLQHARAKVGHSRTLRARTTARVALEASRGGACLAQQEVGRAPLDISPRDVGRARLYPSGARPRAATPQCVADVVVRRGRRRRRRRRLQLRWLQLVRRASLSEGEGWPRAAQRTLLRARLARRYGGEQLQYLVRVGARVGARVGVGVGVRVRRAAP